jgi:hypothetical protein
MEMESGFRICSFEDWLGACRIILDNALNSGAVALKSALAYERSLKYERVNKKDAVDEFI